MVAGTVEPRGGPAALPPPAQEVVSNPVLRHPTRLALYNLVRSNWGIWETELGRLSSLGRNNVKYHLVKLVRAKLIQARPEGRKVHYFPRDIQTQDLQKAIVHAHDGTRRDILELIRDHPTLSWRAIARVLGVTPRAVRWHIGELAKGGLVEIEREGVYCRARLTPLVEAVLAGDVAMLAQNLPDISIGAAPGRSGGRGPEKADELPAQPPLYQ